MVTFKNFANMPKNGLQEQECSNNDKRLKFTAHSQLVQCTKVMSCMKYVTCELGCNSDQNGQCSLQC